MAKFLANENVPSEVVELARQAGHDMKWIAETSPGLDDNAVLAASLAEKRVLLTFDKDFGEMAFRQGKNASCGIILLRPKIRDPDYVTRFALAALAQGVEWHGHFSVAQEGKVRVVPMPEGSKQRIKKPKKRQE
jgi:predicted nuclease of predicted toxin-antitoxin system